MVFTFSCTTNPIKALTFEGVFDFQTKLVGKNGIGFKDLVKTIKKDFTEKELEEDKDHALEYVVVGDKHIEVSDDMSLSREPILVSVRLRWKLKFQESD